jgi:hypothetical protein
MILTYSEDFISLNINTINPTLRFLFRWNIQRKMAMFSSKMDKPIHLK